MLEKEQMSLPTGSCPQTLASWRLILQASVKSNTASPMRLSHGIYTDSLCLPDGKPDAVGGLMLWARVGWAQKGIPLSPGAGSRGEVTGRKDPEGMRQHPSPAADLQEAIP